MGIYYHIFDGKRRGRMGFFKPTTNAGPHIRLRQRCRLLCRVLAVLGVLGLIGLAAAAGPVVLFHEDFRQLDHWRPLLFPKISRHSEYTAAVLDGDAVLRMESNASASALVHQQEFNVYDFPRLAWRWRVEKVYVKGDANSKAGDDYPARIYVMFAYDPATAGFLDKVRYETARLLYGEYPPQSSLNYIWANHAAEHGILVNAYTDRAMMVVKAAGDEQVGTWQTCEVDMVADYRRAFGRQPPARARIAVMNDSDDTGDQAVSYINYIEVTAKPPGGAGQP